jgi:hypothetical protein
MSDESRGFRLVISGAVLTFLFTLATFVSSVATVHATNCWADGYYGIGPNCAEECMNSQWQTCAECASHYCRLLAGYQPEGPWDSECGLTCFVGADEWGCNEDFPHPTCYQV